MAAKQGTRKKRSTRKKQPAPPARKRPKLAVWKFASCDGCQLSLLDCEDELLAVAGAVEIAYFPEATRAVAERAVRRLAGGGLHHHPPRRRSNPRDSARQSRTLVITIGACATYGWHPGPAQLGKNVDEFIKRSSTPIPSTISRHWRTQRPIAVPRRSSTSNCRGCPINEATNSSSLIERIPPRAIGRTCPAYSVCFECKRRGTPCASWSGPRHARAWVRSLKPDVGPYAPPINRGCYGCFGPSEAANTWPGWPSRSAKTRPVSDDDVVRALPDIQRLRRRLPQREHRS